MFPDAATCLPYQCGASDPDGSNRLACSIAGFVGARTCLDPACAPYCSYGIVDYRQEQRDYSTDSRSANQACKCGCGSGGGAGTDSGSAAKRGCTCGGSLGLVSEIPLWIIVAITAIFVLAKRH